MRFDKSTYASPTGEDKDCSVRAFMAVSGMTYEESKAVFEKHGRLENQGTPFEVTEAVIRSMYPESTRLNMSVDRLMKVTGRPVMTVTEFAKAFKQGKWIVHIKGHALAIIDGTIHDWRFRPATRVTVAWQVE
jgi:hypothetical protein